MEFWRFTYVHYSEKHIYMTDQLDASDDICFKFFITVYLTQLLDLNFVLN